VPEPPKDLVLLVREQNHGMRYFVLHISQPLKFGTPVNSAATGYQPSHTVGVFMIDLLRVLLGRPIITEKSAYGLRQWSNKKFE